MHPRLVLCASILSAWLVAGCTAKMAPPAASHAASSPAPAASDRRFELIMVGNDSFVEGQPAPSVPSSRIVATASDVVFTNVVEREVSCD